MTDGSVAMSAKGWTDREISLGCIQRYDEETKDKAGEEWRLIYLDGHDSHASLEIIQYTRRHRIVVVCLPPHTTHVLQPLDVGIFGRFKVALREEAYNYELQTGLPVDKTSALLVIGKAYLRAFTPENIRSAFRKTGMWPLDQGVINALDIAPSEATSILADAPNPLPTIVKKVARAFEELSPIKAPDFTGQSASSITHPADDNTSDNGDSPHTSLDPLLAPTVVTTPTVQVPISPLTRKQAVATRVALQGTSYAYLISKEPASSSDPSPPAAIVPVIPLRRPNFALLQECPNEATFTNGDLHNLATSLRTELDIARHHLNALDKTVNIYQAELIIGETHSRRQQMQLYGREEKARKKGANLVIKPDASKGRVISSEEAETYEHERREAEERERGAKKAREEQRKQRREERDAQKRAKRTERDAAKAATEAKKLRSNAEKLARKKRREEDLQKHAADVRVWAAATANWGKGQGHKPPKPAVPKVRKTPLTDEEIAVAVEIIRSGMNQQPDAAANTPSYEEASPETAQRGDDYESSDGEEDIRSSEDSSQEDEEGYEGGPNDEDYHDSE